MLKRLGRLCAAFLPSAILVSAATAQTTDRLNGTQAGLAIKAPVKAVTSGALTLSGEQTVNSVAVVEGDRVLVKDQSDKTTNGIYVVSMSAWQRAADFDGNRDVAEGALVVVHNDIALGVLYQLTTANPVVFGTSNITFTLSDDPTITYPQTAAEVHASVTPSHTNYPQGDVRRYGAVLDGSTSDATALQAALNVGGTVYIPPGAHGLALASASLPLTLHSNTALIGDGPRSSKIIVKGSKKAREFVGTNIHDFTVSGIDFEGNAQGGSSFGDSTAFQFAQNDAATAIGGTIRIENSRFHNYKADYWLWFYNVSTTYRFENLHVENNVFDSANGNTIGPAGPAHPSHFMSFQGQANGTNGLVRNVWVTGNTANAYYVKGFAIAWESTEDVHFTRNVVRDAGRANSDESASYAFLVYDNSAADGGHDGHGGATPTNVYIDDNTVTAPRDAGVYLASVGALYVRRNTIIGQTSRATDSIPKGAIASNGATTLIAEDNVLDNNYWNVVAYGATASAAAVVRRNHITNVTAGGVGIYFRTTFSGSAKLYHAESNDVDTTNSARALWASFSSAAGIADLQLNRNRLASAYSCIEVSSTSGTALIGVGSVSDNECFGEAASNGGLVLSSLANTSQRLVIDRNRFSGTWGNVYLLDVRSSLGLDLIGNEFNDLTRGGGYCFATTGAQGRLNLTQFNNVAAARRYLTSGREELGVDTPTWRGQKGAFVENLGAADKDGNRMLVGWHNANGSTTWRAMYTSAVSRAN
jgi:hypothetical protein